MAKPTIYKSIDIGAIHNRPTTSLTSAESDKVKVILDNFFDYFEDKHL
jgi:hypothetical protein